MSDTDVAIRVALAEVPAALRSSLEYELAQQSDMRLVFTDPHQRARVDVLLAVAEGIDVLVLGTPDAASPPGICDHLLSEFPALMIVLVSHAGDAASLHWLGPRQYRLRRVSADGLLRVTRRALVARSSPFSPARARHRASKGVC